MTLSFEHYRAQTVSTGRQHSFSEGRLCIDIEMLARSLRERDERLQSVRVDIARPGTSTRILCCKDVVQPRWRRGAAGSGAGVVRLLDNVAVASCGPIVGFQEGIIDMSGPGAAYTPFSELHLLVVQLDVADDLPAHEHEAAVREAGIEAARQVADVLASARPDPDTVEAFPWKTPDPGTGLPRIVYVDLMLSQGLLHDTWVLGENARTGLPRILDPRVLIDDGVISGNCVSACDKNTTFHHQNNPLILELLRGHGQRWDFAGVVATNCPTRLHDKEHSASRAVSLAATLNPDGAIVSKEGFGNPDADLMMLVRGLERAGIRTVAITDEFAGRDGASQSLADVTAEADAVVSTGNANAVVELPPMETVLGPVADVARLAGGYADCLRDDGSMAVELQVIMGATNELGFSRLSARGI